jgi:hypothetical protein
MQQIPSCGFSIGRFPAHSVVQAARLIRSIRAPGPWSSLRRRTEATRRPPRRGVAPGRTLAPVSGARRPMARPLHDAWTHAQDPRDRRPEAHPARAAWTVESIDVRSIRRRGDVVFDRIMKAAGMCFDRQGRIDGALWCVDGVGMRTSRSVVGAPWKCRRTSPKTTRRAARGSGWSTCNWPLMVGEFIPPPVSPRSRRDIRCGSNGQWGGPPCRKVLPTPAADRGDPARGRLGGSPAAGGGDPKAKRAGEP